MGRFLKDFGKLDKTRAGKIMIASGKAVSYSSQQRLALRPSIIRLAEEVDTFYFRAIDDTSQTVSGMEKVRTEYRLFLIRSTHYFLTGLELARVPRVPGTRRNSEHHLWHPRILRFLILTGTPRAHSM